MLQHDSSIKTKEKYNGANVIFAPLEGEVELGLNVAVKTDWIVYTGDVCVVGK